MVVCDDELDRHRSMVRSMVVLSCMLTSISKEEAEKSNRGGFVGDHGINHAVSEDINAMFTGAKLATHGPDTHGPEELRM